MLGVVKPKLHHRTDGNPASEILTLTFEVIFLRNPISIGHWFTHVQGTSSEILAQFEVIFLRNTMSGCMSASLVFKFSGFSGNF